MPKISEQFAQLEIIKTPTFKFPAKVSVEYKCQRYIFKVFFTENSGQHFSTKWLWNIEWLNARNRKVIEEKLQRVEDYLDQQIKRNIQLSIRETRREDLRRQRIEAKVERLFDRY